MNTSDSPAALDILRNLKMLSISSLRDTLTSRSHSRDFAFARGDYLRSRVMIVGVLFLMLLPLWSMIDRFMLPPGNVDVALGGRAAMLAVLLGTLLLAHHSKARLDWARLSAGVLLAAPAAFYALVLAGLPAGVEAPPGYGFIPYMLVAMLAIFPFTLLESAVLGTALLALEAYALNISQTLLTAVGFEALWLLAALLVSAITANYFQLTLMLRLYREATHDPLTGLLNRGALVHSMTQLLLRDPDGQRCLLMLDLDHFKRLNDNNGHAFGDDVLRNFAGILRRTLRSTDLIARYGGEEFVVVVNDADKNMAMELAEQIRRETEASTLTNYEGVPVNYTVSIGVASFQPGERFQSAVVRADARLYEAKKIARNCVVGA